jgi:hypothetical protein
MSTDNVTYNSLHELAQILAADKGHAAAITLRRLAEAV